MSSSSSPPLPHILGLSSSGQALPIHLGAMRYLQEHTDILEHVDTFVAASGGALLAGFLAAKVPLHEITKAMTQMDFVKTLQPSIPSFIQTGGMVSQKAFDIQVQLVLAKGLGERKARTLTLAQLKEDMGITLVLSVVRFRMKDMTRENIKNTLLYLDPVNQPDVPLYRALTIACTIPGVVEPAFIEGFDGLFFDGALLNASPFVSANEEETLAIRLVQPVNSDQTTRINGLRDTISMFFGMLKQTVSFTEEMLLEAQDFCPRFVETHRVCEINCEDYPSLTLSVSRQHKEKMIRVGYDTLKDHLEQHFPSWVLEHKKEFLPTQEIEEESEDEDEEIIEEDEDEEIEEDEEGQEEEALSSIVMSMQAHDWETGPEPRRRRRREQCSIQ